MSPKFATGDATLLFDFALVVHVANVANVATGDATLLFDFALSGLCYNFALKGLYIIA